MWAPQNVLLYSGKDTAFCVNVVIKVYIEAENRSSEFLNDLMTNDLNDHIFRFSCFVMSMQTAIIQGVKNCLPLGLADGAVSTDPSPTRQKGCRRPTS